MLGLHSALVVYVAFQQAPCLFMKQQGRPSVSSGSSPRSDPLFGFLMAVSHCVALVAGRLPTSYPFHIPTQ